MSNLVVGILGALLGALAGFATHRLDVRLGADEPDATGNPLPGEGLWAPALDALGLGLLGARFGLQLATLAAAAVYVVLTQVLVFDTRHRLILNRVIYPAIVVALILSPVNPLLGAQHLQTRALSATLGAAIAGGIFFVLVALSRGGIGLGDAKLAFFLGAALGFFPLPGSPVIRALVYGILLGAVAAVLLLVTRTRGFRDYIPYGPFLCLGAMLEIIIFGPPAPF